MLKSIREILQKSQSIDSTEAQILLSHMTQQSREFIITHPEKKVDLLNYLKFRRLVNKRKKGVPVAYLTGHKEFFGLDILVNKYTLVPRPETEILVEKVIEEIRNKKLEIGEIILIDVGTGSGCIPISILKNINRNNIKAFAIDISKQALKIAQQNASNYNVDINFLQGNLLEPISKFHNSLFRIPNSQIIITANLPYLTQEQFDEEPSIQHEPKSALVADDNGLALYKKLLEQIKEIALCYMCHVTCFMEIDPSQSQPLLEYIKSIFPKANIEVIKDLSGNDRVVKVKT